MAKTIGKDKASLGRTRGAAAKAETEPVGDPSNDEPRNEDMMAPEDTALLDTDAESTAETDTRDLAVSRDTSVTNRSAASVSRTGGRHAPVWMHNVGATRFIAESIDELFKVTWPTPTEAWNMTLIVIAMSAVVALILGVADAGLIKALEWLVSVGTATPKH